MFTKKSYDGPPMGYGPPTAYGPPTGDYGYDYGARSPPPGSYYMEDVPQHFYKWTSPPGVVRILEAVVILLCVAVFACVASTLAWEYGYGYGGVYGNGLGGYYGSGYYGSGLSYGYGYGYGSYYGGVTNPRTANGFMMAMAVLCFLAQLGLFVTSVTKSSSSRSRRFYLVVIVVCAVLAFVMLIASIVYVVGVNPQAQMTGSYYYSPLLTMCNQIYSTGTYLNQYLYHYCTVDPQEVRVHPSFGQTSPFWSQTHSTNPLLCFKRDAVQGQREWESVGDHVGTCPWPHGVFLSIFNVSGGAVLWLGGAGGGDW